MTHRITPNSKLGRQQLGQDKRLVREGAQSALTQQQVDWNAAVERKRALKKEGKNK